MRICIYAGSFSPNLGGTITIAVLLGSEFVRMGHAVELITETKAGGTEKHPFEVHRCLKFRGRVALCAKSDILLSIGLSGWAIAYARLARIPILISHQMFPSRQLKEQTKGLLRFMAVNVGCSEAVAKALGSSALAIANPYDDEIFVNTNNTRRERDIAFVGRVVNEKGVDILLRAFAKVAAAYDKPKLTVIGDGDRLTEMRELARALGIDDRVRFAGRLGPDMIAAELRRHSVLAVPSVWEEPFGIVALEGMACGCIPVVARSGGLPEAAGSGSVMYEKSDAEGLAAALARALYDPKVEQRFQQSVDTHLDKHRKRKVADQYLEVIQRAINSRSNPILIDGQHFSDDRSKAR